MAIKAATGKNSVKKDGPTKLGKSLRAAQRQDASLKERVKEKRQGAGRPLTKTQELLNAILRTMEHVRYSATPAVGVTLHPAALTSLDAEGYPTSRTVIPSFIAPDLSEVRIPTRRGTRKEVEIAANSKVSLHFQDIRGRGGWATIKGDAQLVGEGEEGAVETEDVEILVKPSRCEIMSYTEETKGDEEGWKPVFLVRQGEDGWRVKN